MNLHVVGVSHHKCPVEIRERLAFSKEQIQTILQDWKQSLPGFEVVMLCTCNRTEVYFATDDSIQNRDQLLIAQLAKLADFGEEQLRPFLFHYDDRRAIEHLFRVAASLDSMVLGETQITSQVRTAFELAEGVYQKMPMLNQAFLKAVTAAKAIATKTSINRHRTSVASVAISGFASDIFETLADKRILIIGAGEIAVETLNYLHGYGARHIHVVNRSRERAEALAQQFEGVSHDWSELANQLQEADVAVSATAADQFLLPFSTFQSIHQKRRQRTLLILDLAIPRDFDPEIGELTNVYLYSVDDLKSQCERNRKLREKELPKAESIIEEHVDRFLQECNLRWTAPTIRMLRDQTQSLKEEEFMRLMNKLSDISPDHRKEIEVAFDRLVNKMLHSPMHALRDEARQGRPVGLTESLKRLFGLQSDADN